MPSDSGEKRAYPPPAQAEHLPCPRCDSTNTKFCYYNNYNLSQPRHFCKACRRYWTQGGTLRNIPVGGGTRKTSKRPRPSSSVMLDRPVEHHVNMIGSSANPISGGVFGPGSFTSFLGGLGSSPGFEEMGPYGIGGRGIWGFPQVGNAAESGGCGGHGGGGLGSMWQANGGESGMVDGECFGSPELAIFMSGQGLK